MKSQKKNNSKKTYSRKNKRTERNVKKNSRTKKMIGGFDNLKIRLDNLLKNSNLQQDTNCSLIKENFFEEDVNKLCAVLSPPYLEIVKKCNLINETETETLKEENKFVLKDDSYLKITKEQYPNMQINTNLKKLDISNTNFYSSTDHNANLSNASIQKILVALSFNKNLTTLKMSGIPIDPKSAQILAIALGKNGVTTLKSLDISNCGITDDNMEGVSLSNSLNTNLEELDISNNKFTDTMLELFFGKLLENTTLKILKMSGNNFTTDNINTLADVLELNTILETLDISNCGFTDDGTHKIITALINNTDSKLTTLNIKDNKISKKDKDLLKKLGLKFTIII